MKTLPGLLLVIVCAALWWMGKPYGAILVLCLIDGLASVLAGFESRSGQCTTSQVGSGRFIFG